MSKRAHLTATAPQREPEAAAAAPERSLHPSMAAPISSSRSRQANIRLFLIPWSAYLYSEKYAA